MFLFKHAFYRVKNYDVKAVLHMKILKFVPDNIDFKVIKIFGLKGLFYFKWPGAKFEYPTLAEFSCGGSYMLLF